MATVYCYAIVYDYPTTGKPTLAEFWTALKGAWLALLTPVFVIGGIVGGIVTPTESAIIAAFYSFFLGVFVYRTINLKDTIGILYETGRFASISLFAIGTASVFGWMLSFYNVPRLIVGIMTDLQLGQIGTSLIIAALFLLFGLFIDAIPAIIILGTVLFPVASAAEIHPVVFAIIGIVSLAFGLVTPPYGSMAAFVIDARIQVDSCYSTNHSWGAVRQKTAHGKLLRIYNVCQLPNNRKSAIKRSGTCSITSTVRRHGGLGSNR